MPTAKIISAGPWHLTCSVLPIDAMPGLFNMKFESTQDDSRDPSYKRNALSITIDSHSLNEISRAIHEAIQQGVT